MAWWLLLAAGAVEIVMAVALKYAEGWTRPVPSIVGIAAALASVFLLTHAVRDLPAGTAYAVWTGIGAIGTVLAGVVLFGESLSPLRLACIGVIVAGVMGLKFVEA